MIRIALIIFLLSTIGSCDTNKGLNSKAKQVNGFVEFNMEKDLLLLHYDCKTDVDDLHSIAAAASLIRFPQYSKLKYHAVAGSYGIQKGKYVPANSLFKLAFDESWSDAHIDFNKALNDVFVIVQEILNNGGDIWIAEAGQSDFSSGLIAKVIKRMNEINTEMRIHIIQHSDWNEKETSSENLAFVKENSNYQKIPDGNTLNNGTPGFNTSNHLDYGNILKSKEIIEIWDLARSLADTYNGAEGRYLNQSIKEGGMDFSDFCEVHNILKLKNIENCEDYFKLIQNQTNTIAR